MAACEGGNVNVAVGGLRQTLARLHWKARRFIVSRSMRSSLPRKGARIFPTFHRRGATVDAFVRGTIIFCTCVQAAFRWSRTAGFDAAIAACANRWSPSGMPLAFSQVDTRVNLATRGTPAIRSSSSLHPRPTLELYPSEAGPRRVEGAGERPCRTPEAPEGASAGVTAERRGSEAV